MILFIAPTWLRGRGLDLIWAAALDVIRWHISVFLFFGWLSGRLSVFLVWEICHLWWKAIHKKKKNPAKKNKTKKTAVGCCRDIWARRRALPGFPLRPTCSLTFPEHQPCVKNKRGKSHGARCPTGRRNVSGHRVRCQPARRPDAQALPADCDSSSSAATAVAMSSCLRAADKRTRTAKSCGTDTSCTFQWDCATRWDSTGFSKVKSQTFRVFGFYEIELVMEVQPDNQISSRGSE